MVGVVIGGFHNLNKWSGRAMRPNLGCGPKEGDRFCEDIIAVNSTKINTGIASCNSLPYRFEFCCLWGD